MSDYSGFPKSVLKDIFNGMIENLSAQKKKPDSPELPEPMLGPMGLNVTEGNSEAPGKQISAEDVTNQAKVISTPLKP